MLTRQLLEYTSGDGVQVDNGDSQERDLDLATIKFRSVVNYQTELAKRGKKAKREAAQKKRGGLCCNGLTKEQPQMCNFRAIIFQGIMLASVLFGGAFVTSAQSSIFNIPSTDTQPKKTLYLETDLFAHFDAYQNGGFQSYGPAIIYGVRKDLEIGVNLYYSREESKSTVELQPNIKWKAYENQKTVVSVSFGAIAFVPVNRAAGTRPTALLYANASKTIESASGMRLTGGIYQMLNTEQDFGTKTGAILGVQQPITKKMSLLADWYSGKNRFGYSTVGLGYEVSESQYFGIGYSFGNSGRGNNYFTAFYGFTF